MRKVSLFLLALCIISLVIAYYPKYVEKPVKDGEGPLAVYVDPRLPAPEYHNPLEWWKLNHKSVVNRVDLEQVDCLKCHDPATSCNNCHSYVGAAEISGCLRCHNLPTSCIECHAGTGMPVTTTSP